jgi:cbb3-type cytochrome c oxidase subunit III
MRSLVIVLVAVLAVPAAAAAQTKDSLPPGVTPEMLKEGKTLFGGAGICAACHGSDAKGMPGLGANLTDNKWLHSDGSYDAIVKQIMTGVSSSQSTTGAAMPPKGGSSLTDAQVKAVAAYVWSLSHPPKK